MPTKLTPVRHPTLDDHHRVPIALIDGKYEIYVGEDYVRIFEPNDLPDLIKIRLAMIRASTLPDSFSHDNLDVKAYELPKNPAMAEIGWQPREQLFVAVLPTKYLTCLRGDEYDGMGFISYAKPTFSYLEEFTSTKNMVYFSTIGKFSEYP
jgi:hypothetical protein